VQFGGRDAVEVRTAAIPHSLRANRIWQALSAQNLADGVMFI
jgi:hypothetical protein